MASRRGPPIGGVPGRASGAAFGSPARGEGGGISLPPGLLGSAIPGIQSGEIIFSSRGRPGGIGGACRRHMTGAFAPEWSVREVPHRGGRTALTGIRGPTIRGAPSRPRGPALGSTPGGRQRPGAHRGRPLAGSIHRRPVLVLKVGEVLLDGVEVRLAHNWGEVRRGRARGGGESRVGFGIKQVDQIPHAGAWPRQPLPAVARVTRRRGRRLLRARIRGGNRGRGSRLGGWGARNGLSQRGLRWRCRQTGGGVRRMEVAV